MKSDSKLCEICIDIYKELYKLATPSLDFDDAVKSGITAKPDWFLDYYLSVERQIAVIYKHIKKNKLCNFDAKKIRFEIFLGAAPSSCKETVDAKRHGVKND